ncbi:MAG: hypothetical protein ISN26_07020, partial [Betaproteobacteria bacterium AqS2]|nr:hypothetical protein [Betaproteobacteria bacterium AqS2]
MAKALAVLGWLGRAAGGLLLVLLGLFVFIHGLGRFIGWEVYEGLLHRAYGLFMLTAGGYWVGAGLLLIGGRRPPP